jgi:two-component system cell cycle sensor histidine kinase/response regulator CckA
VVHDFNDILSVIIDQARAIRERVGGDQPLAGRVAEVEKAARRGASLTQELLAFGSKQVFEPQVLPLDRVVAAAESLLLRVVGKDIELRVVPYHGELRVRVDPRQIEQALMNLAVNARDAMPCGGVLTLETANVSINPDVARRRSVEQGDYVELSVSDTGTGIPPDVRVRLFEPFFTTKDRNRGTGLGLATVYGIVKQSGGHIIVESEVGQGSKFAIYLPACAASAETSLPEHRVQSEQGSETVLVVEQDKGVRSLIGDVLRRRGYRLLVAQDGPDALRVADEHDSTIHLLITSLSVPAAAGAAVAAALRERRPDTRVLFLQKPFTPVGLARKVRGILENNQVDAHDADASSEHSCSRDQK